MLLRLIALLEGFSTLAVQMVALRMAIPVVGSSVVLTSVYIGVILLALSAGYRVGGILADKYKDRPRYIGMLLTGYLLIAGVRYSLITFGMHSELLSSFLTSTESYLLTLFVVSVIFFVIPVFLASQTIPLLTQLIPTDSKGHAAGQMLFASTIGSFLGSVLTSTVLFGSIGVEQTGVLTVSIILLAGVLSMKIRRPHSQWWIFLVRVILSGGLVFSVKADENILYQTDTPYHSIQIKDYSYGSNQVKLMVTNGGFSSARDPTSQSSPFPYIRELVEQTHALQPKTILLIGTAGFTYPAELQDQPRLERIDAIDIDDAFLEIAQDHLLGQSLNSKIYFSSQSARHFLQQAIAQGTQYDLVVLDAYNGRFVPAELATVEFFLDVQKVMHSDSELLSNLIIDYDLSSDFAQTVLASMQSIFPDLRIHKLHRSPRALGNSIIANYSSAKYKKSPPIDHTVATDDRHQLESDLVKMWRSE